MRFGLNTRIGRGLRIGIDARSTYSPFDEGSLVLDFDATVTSSYTRVAGAISQITNLATGVAWSQATAGKRAAYDATGWNGGPCFVPDGIDDAYISTESAVLNALQCSTVARPYTMFAVCSTAASFASSTIFGVGNTGFSNSHRRKWGSASASNAWLYEHSRDDISQFILRTYSAQNTDASAGVKRLVSWWGDTVHFVQNDRGIISSGSATPVATTINQAALFVRPDNAPDNFFAGKFVRLLIFAALLNDDARARVQDHLQFKHLT